MSTRDLPKWVEERVRDGFRKIGEIVIEVRAEGGFVLRHLEDVGVAELAAFSGPSEARRLAMNTEGGEFRALKTAPTLRRGWVLELADAEALCAALDYFYPAMLGVWADACRGGLVPVPLRATLDRQTGMYAASKRLQEEEGQGLVAEACAVQKCLKRVLWDYAPGQAVAGLCERKRFQEAMRKGEGQGGEVREIPLLCHEACNLLVAAARETVKSRERAAAAAAASQTSASVGPAGAGA